MTILCLGSVNIDYVYRVPHFAAPGETLAAEGYAVHLGGKGANMTLAAALAEGDIAHVGAVGPGSGWIKDRLSQAGADIGDLRIIQKATGHARILVDPAGENSIIIWPGANRAIPKSVVTEALGRRAPGDWLLIQNETNLVSETAAAARARGLRVAYAAAPFDADAAAEVLPNADLLCVNEVEAGQLAGHLGVAPDDLPVAEVLVTLGARGVRYRGPDGQTELPGFAVDVVDTTGAGDTFLGVFLAALDGGAPVRDALRRAAAAAAIQVTRPGAADAIPTKAEVDAFLAERSE
ncbi:MAG: ribokinase [Pseudomonadota bacterium]